MTRLVIAIIGMLYASLAYGQSAYWRISDAEGEIANANEIVLRTVLRQYVVGKVLPHPIDVRLSKGPWSSRGTDRFSFEWEVFSVGSQRREGEDFTDRLSRYSPGIHVHGYVTLSTLKQRVTLEEANALIPNWLEAYGPIRVFLRGESVSGVEQARVCRMSLRDYEALSRSTRLSWTDCFTIAEIRRGRWR